MFKDLFSHRKVFFLVLIFKILLLGSFSSDYKDILFVPFVNQFLFDFSNPWQYFYENNLNIDSFPYHPLMLYVLMPFSFIIDYFNIENIFLSNLIFKLPLLLADLLIYFTFLKLFPNHTKKILFFYFINPLILYATFIHSQLDIIPMSLLFLAIYELSKVRLDRSALFLGLSLATKSHILISIPIFLFYVFKSFDFKILIRYIMFLLLTFVFFEIPYIFSKGFQKMVLLNSKQSVIFDSYLNIGELELLLPVASILFVYFHLFTQNRINKDLLYFYFGLLFTVTILFISPVPSWYIWIVPFIAIYFVKSFQRDTAIAFHLVFCLSYLVFFIFFYQPEYTDLIFLESKIDLKINNKGLINISYTILISILVCITYLFYNFGITSNSLYKNQNNLLVGIGGDSSAGKTTIMNKISSIINKNILVIEGDAEHKWERNDKNWNNFTHLNPKANFIHKQADLLKDLKTNKSIFRSDYDHKSGKFTIPKKIIPKRFIFISGLHSFYLPKQRKIFDLKIFVNTDDNLRKHWKIIRDTKERGYDNNSIIEQIEKRSDDGKKYILPQQAYADCTIKYFATNNFEIGDNKSIVNLGLRIDLDANIKIDNLLSSLDIEYEWDYNDNLMSQYIILNAIPQIDFESLAKQDIINLDEIVDNDCDWEHGYFGLIQYLFILMMSIKLKEE